MVPRPLEAIVAVNYKCNARCVMCDIWRLRDDGDLSASDYGRLPHGLENVGVTGGEPFLRKDIHEIVRVIYEAVGRPRIIINTNGYLTDRIAETFRKLRGMKPSVGVGISLDGIGDMHDTIRGTPGAYRKVLRTIEALKSNGVKDIRISYTATPKNVEQLFDVYELCRALRVQFSATLAHNSEHYFHTTANRDIDADLLRQAYEMVNQRELSTWSVKRWSRAYYNHGVVAFNETQRRLVKCDAARDFFFLSPRGDIYPCIIVPKVIGNILARPFEEVWASEQAAHIRSEIEGCQACWMMCSARTTLKRNAPRVAWWVGTEMTKRFLGTNHSPRKRRSDERAISLRRVD